MINPFTNKPIDIFDKKLSYCHYNQLKISYYEHNAYIGIFFENFLIHYNNYHKRIAIFNYSANGYYYPSAIYVVDNVCMLDVDEIISKMYETFQIYKRTQSLLSFR